MPIFSGLRDTRGRFVGQQTANDLEAALEDAITNVNPASWKRFALLTQQRLGGDPWDLIRRYAGQIPVGQFAQSNRARYGNTPPPFVPGPGGQGFGSDVGWKRTFEEINKHLKNIDDIQTRFTRNISIPPWPTRAQMAGNPGMGPWGARVLGPGGSVPPFPGLGGGGFGGGGGGGPPRVFGTPAGGGGGFRGGGGGGGGGFGLGGGMAMGGPVGRLLRAGGFGLAEFEVVRDLLNPIGALSRDILSPLTGAASRSWDFRTRATMMARAGGFSPGGMISQFYPGGTWPGALRPPMWMQQLGIGPEEALGNLQEFGIMPRSQDEAMRNAMILSMGEQGAIRGFAGMNRGSATGFARTAMGLGVGGGQELGGMPLMERMGLTLEDAVTKGLDRARVLANIETSMEQVAKVGGPTVMLPQMLGLFDTLMKSTLPGGGTGDAARQAISGQAEALRTVGQDPMRTLTMQLAMRRHGMNLRSVLGPDISGAMTPEMESALQQAQDLANRGLMGPAAQILAQIIPPESQRWLQLQQEIVPSMLPFKGLQGLGIAQGSGVPFMTQQGMQLAPRLEGIKKGGMAEKMFQWAKAHGYTDQAASVMVGMGSWESGLRPGLVNQDLMGGTDLGLFQLNSGGELGPFLSWAQANGKDPKSMEAQMEWADMRMSKIAPGFKQGTDIDELTGQFLQFERPATQFRQPQMRASVARRALNVLGGPQRFGAQDIALTPQEQVGMGASDQMPTLGKPFGDLVSGLPAFNPAMAIASQAGLAGSTTAAQEFADHIGTITNGSAEFASSLNKAGGAVDEFAKIMVRAWNDLKTLTYGPGAGQSQTSPSTQVQ